MSKYFAKHSNDDLVSDIESVKTSPEVLLQTLEGKLKEGIVVFFYRKSSDGSIRKAIGTKKSDIIPFSVDKYDALLCKTRDFISAAEDYSEDDDKSVEIFETQFGELRDLFLSQIEAKVTKAKKKPNDAVITYYDFEAKAPRAMKKDSLISIF